MCLLMCSTIKEIIRVHISLVKKDLIIRECTFFFFNAESSISDGLQVRENCHMTNIPKVFSFSWVKIVQGSWESVKLWNGND